MTHFANPTHPIWPIVRLVVLMIALSTVLYLTASNFDDTEIIALTGAFLAAASVEGGVRAIRGAMKEPEKA